MVCIGVRKWEREAGFHQQLDNDLMYFRRLVAMDLQGNLIFGRVNAGDIYCVVVKNWSQRWRKIDGLQ